MTYIKPIALTAALLAALTISFPVEAKSDTLSSAEEAVEEGKISDKDLDLLFQQLQEAYRKGGNDSSFDWKGMSSVILGEILKSDDVQKNKKLKDILDILTGGSSPKEEPAPENRDLTAPWMPKCGQMMGFAGPSFPLSTFPKRTGKPLGTLTTSWTLTTTGKWKPWSSCRALIPAAPAETPY